MTQDEIIRMARQAGFDIDKALFVEHAYVDDIIVTAKLERFAALVAAHEREKQAEQEPVAWGRVFDGDIIDCICPEEHALNEGDYTIPLYAAPQPAEQEPVAWMWHPSKEFPNCTVVTDEIEKVEAAKSCGVVVTPLYADPVRTKDLTDDELLSELKLLDASTQRLPIGFKLFARAVIAADREKNK